MSEIRTILHHKKRKTRATLSRDALVFLFCVALSTIFWLLFTLSKTKVEELSIPVVYSNYPVNYIITDSLHQEIKVRIKDSGFSILFYQLSNNQKNIQIDLKKCFTETKTRTLCLSQVKLQKSVLQTIRPTMQVLHIYPSRITVKYEKLYEKELPIVLKGNIDLSQQHILKDPIKIQPSIVKVYGAKSSLDSLKVVSTKAFNLTNISKTTQVTTRLQPIKNIRFSVNEIKVFIPVELYTEKTLTIPIVGKNFPEHIQLKTFPSTVNVKFNVGLSKFNAINTSDIQAFINYNNLLNAKEGKQAVEITTSSYSIKNLNHSPKMVEYILEGK